ncbi:MAG TPA: hypothetical protein VG940_09295 [Gemmatimonadales bacterium]|nr:hypothetical protein [Gemmatimonadales bacterium]
MDLGRLLFLVGGVPFVVLGLLHAKYTPVRVEDRNGLSPRDEGVARAMADTSPRLTDRTDLWRAWVGFNYSHSLGAVLLGLMVWMVGRSEPSYHADAALAVPIAIVVATSYLVLGIKYWFRTPVLGISVGLACFLAAWILR